MRQASISDPELAEVDESWPGLPGEVKAGILAMVKGDGGEIGRFFLDPSWPNRYIRYALTTEPGLTTEAP